MSPLSLLIIFFSSLPMVCHCCSLSATILLNVNCCRFLCRSPQSSIVLDCHRASFCHYRRCLYQIGFPFSSSALLVTVGSLLLIVAVGSYGVSYVSILSPHWCVLLFLPSLLKAIVAVWGEMTAFWSVFWIQNVEAVFRAILLWGDDVQNSFHSYEIMMRKYERWNKSCRNAI